MFIFSFFSASSLSKYTKFFIIGSYVYACLWASLPLLGWGEYGVEPYGTSCTLKWTSDKEFVTLMLISCIILPVFVMKYCYGGVYLYLRRHCKKFRTDRSKTGNNIRKREEYLIKVSMELTGCLLLKIIKGIGLREARSLLKQINKQTMWKPKIQLLRRPSGWGIGSVFKFIKG